MEDAPTLMQLSGEESYIPKIAAHTKSWPSFLARNYYRLNNVKLCMTLLINIILLTYQVSLWPRPQALQEGMRLVSL